MDKILQEIKAYFNNTPQEELEKDWLLLKESTSHCDGPSVDEFLGIQESCDNFCYKNKKQSKNNQRKMRKVIFMLAIVLLTLIVGCTKEKEVIVVVPNVKVQLNMKQVFNVEEDDLLNTRSTTRSTYVHEYPSLYKAYFIADETKGDYTTGQLVTTIEVIPGLQTITIPKLKYKVFVTNYIGTQESWYTWSNALEHLPQASNTLYLFGSNVIDYKLDIVGEVVVKNPYAAVMIQGSTRITKAPFHYDTSTDYVQVADGWWLKYIRNKTTNTEIVVEFTHENRTVTINDSIEANKIYKYTLLTDVPETDDEGNFLVDVEDFKDTENREVIVW